MIDSCVLWNLAQCFLNTCWVLVSHEFSTRTLGLIPSHTRDISGTTLQGGTLGCVEAVFNQTVFMAPTCLSLFVQSAVKKDLARVGEAAVRMTAGCELWSRPSALKSQATAVV